MSLNFHEQIAKVSNQSILLCYHCHKCTAGCPVAAEMEYGPDRILRMVQLGERERVLKSRDIWLCAACETCGARCPNHINVAKVIDALRMEALRSGVTPAEPDAAKFHKLFLFVVQTLGRSHEASLLIAYKLWTLNLLADMDSGLQLFLKGKVPVLPKTIKGRGQVKRIFVKSAEAVAKRAPSSANLAPAQEVQ
ncbi:MAG: 4Fe-4S dicluster domain-containing protein [Anaerolineales bacterium]|nr:4Fe-4S dicluster domain-containing protein [Anaerolineales bacterium]MCS7248094.1 4Fe-4S dicluster domain-containing protein [Anaerolineales bacterium]MDW8161906.1 4Fe-4S dicluster domain-containing protein [Anaerolineales bacterium]MDW8447030.1 4Fe-4S dicluster domain-containing protein [Anaerolineales bacterium]